MRRGWLVVVCCFLGAGSVEAQGEVYPPLEILFVVSPEGEARDLWIEALTADLARTPLRHRTRFVESESLGVGISGEGVMAVFEIDLGGGREDGLEDGLRVPRIALARSDELVSPGWLVHRVLRAGKTVDRRVDVVDRRSSWIGQLVARSTRRLPVRSSDRALADGVPSLRLSLPEVFSVASANDDASALVAAMIRHLDGLEGSPVWEDQFLVAAGRVWLRRDLYWLGLGLWLLLYWRGRGLPGREFRWLLLIAWLVAPVFGTILLSVPAWVAAWRPPGPRWLRLAALLPCVFFVAGLVAAVTQGSRPVVAGLPAALVLLSLAAFIWSYVWERVESRDTPEP